MRVVMAMLLIMLLAGCGSVYSLKTGGWVIEKTADRGTCLTVHGDGDPEVVIVCIADPEPVKLPKSFLDAACPKTETPPVPATGGSDGA